MIFETRTDQVVIDCSLDGDSVGVITVSNWHDGVFAYRLFVDPKCRRRGIASGLIQEARRYANGKPLYLCPKAYAESPMSTASLVLWYERLGFVVLPAGWWLENGFDDRNEMIMMLPGDSGSHAR